jgi:VanZ family protein
MATREQSRWLRKPAFAVLLVYWLAMAGGTHWPIPPELLRHQSDKLLHLGSYFVLALLVCFNWSLWRAFGWRQAVVVVVGLAVLGVIDEVTQIPVGRDANAGDWLADCAGAAAGATAFLFAAALAVRWPD